MYFKIIFTLITTITQQSSIKTEQFIDVQGFFPLLASPFMPKDRKDKQRVLATIAHRPIQTTLLQTSKREPLSTLSISRGAFVPKKPKCSGVAQCRPIVVVDAPRRGGIWSLVCVEAFYYLFLFFLSFMFKTCRVLCRLLYIRKLNFCFPLALDQRQRFRFGRWIGFFFFLSTRKIVHCKKKEKLFFYVFFFVASPCYVPSALIYRKIRHAVKVEKLFF